MAKGDIAKQVYAVSDVLGYEEKVSSKKRALSFLAPNEICKEKADCEKAPKALGSGWKYKDEPALFSFPEVSRKVGRKDSACAFDERR